MVLSRSSALTLGSVLGVVVFLCLVGIAMFFFRITLRSRLGQVYDRVEHSLDEEEIEFKKIIEMRSDDIEVDMPIHCSAVDVFIWM